MIKLKTLLLNKHDTSTRLTRIQSLNEGIFRKKGKLKDLIKNLFNRGGNNEQIVHEIDPYLDKYGRYAGNPCTVDGTNLLITSNEQLSNSEAKSETILCRIGIITHEPQPLPEDPNKESQFISYLLNYYKMCKLDDINIYIKYLSWICETSEYLCNLINQPVNKNKTKKLKFLLKKDNRFY
jgi:hypothetical protein